MNIAFLRLSSSIELNLATASTNTLGTELRVGLLRALVELGHRVTIYSGVPKKDTGFLEPQGLFQDEKTEWIRKIRYEPDKLPKDEDILLIEQGTDNVRFSYNSCGKDISFIMRTFQCIDSFEGRIVYYQHGALPFPFRDKDATVDSVLNLRNMNKNFDLWKNKDWTIWHHFTDWDAYMELGNSYSPFTERLNYVFTMLPHSSITEPYFKIKDNPEWDALFIGSQWDSRSTKQGFERSKEILRFYDVEGIKSAIMGKWEDKTVDGFRHCTYLGQKGAHGDAYRFWNNSYSCIYTTSEVISRCGLLPSRLTMANHGGAVVLYDNSLDCARLMDDRWCFNTVDEMRDMIDDIKSSDIHTRDGFRTKQLSVFPEWKEVDFTKVFGDKA